MPGAGAAGIFHPWPGHHSLCLNFPFSGLGNTETVSQWHFCRPSDNFSEPLGIPALEGKSQDLTGSCRWKNPVTMPRKLPGAQPPMWDDDSEPQVLQHHVPWESPPGAAGGSMVKCRFWLRSAGGARQSAFPPSWQVTPFLLLPRWFRGARNWVIILSVVLQEH